MYATATVPAGLLPEWPGTLDLDIDPADVWSMTSEELDGHLLLVKEALDAGQHLPHLVAGLASVRDLIGAAQDIRAGGRPRVRWPFPPEPTEPQCPSSCRDCGGQGC